ncbi:MAG: hydrogenase maturation protease [Burkholderiales bacterium]|nr:hydrogenase maturation protease [Burkholderiales bacterium]
MNPVLVAGVGNIFLGDDAFGVEVAQRLARRALPQGVQVVDFGIRALDLGYALQDGYAAAILVDTVQRGGPPGSLYVIEPESEPAGSDGDRQQLSPHDMSPGSVLRYARTVEGSGSIVLVGCEPESFGNELEGEGRMGLSEPVAAAVDKAVELIEAMVIRMAEQDRGMRELSTELSAKL